MTHIGFTLKDQSFKEFYVIREGSRNSEQYAILEVDADNGTRKQHLDGDGIFGYWHDYAEAEDVADRLCSDMYQFRSLVRYLKEMTIEDLWNYNVLTLMGKSTVYFSTTNLAIHLREVMVDLDYTQMRPFIHTVRDETLAWLATQGRG